MGGPPNFVLPQILIFFDLKPHAKLWNPMITPSGRKVPRRRERRKRNNAVNSGHFRDSARKPLGPKFSWTLMGPSYP